MTMDGAGLMVAIYETTSSLESALRLTIGPASLAVHCCWPCSVATPRLWQPSVRWGHASPRRLGSEEKSSLWYGLLDEKKLLSPPIGHRSEIWKTGVVVISSNEVPGLGRVEVRFAGESALRHGEDWQPRFLI